VVDVQDYPGRGDDLPDLPGIQANVAEGSVCHLQQGVAIRADGPLLQHITASRNEIELIARDTGALRTVTLASRPISLVCYPG
jgi:hypothetical protein